jgi:uncharacterized protein DUF2019
MKKLTELPSDTIEGILLIYAEQAVANRIAINNGDPDAANAAYNQVLCCSKELKRRGPQAQRALLSLLNHTDPGVRFCAAMDALQIAPGMGEAELARLAKSTNVCGAKAAVILQEWQRGTLKLPV